MVNQCTKFEVSRLYVHPLRNYEWRFKMQKMGWFGQLGVNHAGSAAMSPFDRAHTTSYSTLIETMRLSRTVFEI